MIIWIVWQIPGYEYGCQIRYGNGSVLGLEAQYYNHTEFRCLTTEDQVSNSLPVFHPLFTFALPLFFHYFPSLLPIMSFSPSFKESVKNNSNYPLITPHSTQSIPDISQNLRTHSDKRLTKEPFVSSVQLGFLENSNPSQPALLLKEACPMLSGGPQLCVYTQWIYCGKPVSVM